MKKNQRKIGVILSYTGEAVKILTNLIYTPVMLRLLGQSEYGLYQLVHSVVAYLGLLNLGFGSAYVRFYSRYKSEDDNDGIGRLNGMFMTIFCLISLICLVCGFIMVKNIRGIFATGLTDMELDKAKILMIIMVVNLAITFPSSVFSCILTSNEQFFFQKFVVLLNNLLNPFLTLPLLLMGYGSIGMVIVSFFLSVLAFLVNMYYCFKILHVKFIFKNFEKALFVEMGAFTFFIFLNKMIDQINWSVDKFLLGRISGTSSVAIYGVGGQINSMYVATSSVISNVFVPQVNRIVAENRGDEKLTELFTKIGRIQFMILGLVISGFILLGKTFVKFWAGIEYQDAYFVTLLLIIPVTVPLIQNLGIEIQRAKNKHRARSLVYFGIAIINVFISIPLIKMWGPCGAALGTTIALVAGNILFMNWYYYRHLGLDIPFFWISIFKILPPLVLAMILGWGLVRFISIDNYINFALVTFIYMILYFVLMWFLGMNNYEKKLLLGLKEAVMRKKK